MYIKGWLFNGAVMSQVRGTGVNNQDLIALAERVPPNTVNGTSQSNNSSTSLKSNDIFSRAAALSNPITPNSNIEEIKLITQKVAFGFISFVDAARQITELYHTKGNGSDITQYSELQNPNTLPLMRTNYFAATVEFNNELQELASKSSPVGDFLQYNEGQKWFRLLKEKQNIPYQSSILPSDIPSELKSFIESKNLNENKDVLKAIQEYAVKTKDYKTYSLVTGMPPDVLIDQVRKLVAEFSEPRINTSKALWDTSNKRLNDLVTSLVGGGGRQNG